MASRPIIAPHSVITNGDMSANIISEPTIITNLSMISYDISWTGTSPVGEMSVQVSNSYRVNAAGAVSNAGNWQTITLSEATNVTGNTGNGFINVAELAGYAIRLVYTRASGTGTMQAVLNAKVA